MQETRKYGAIWIIYFVCDATHSQALSFLIETANDDINEAWLATEMNTNCSKEVTLLAIMSV